MTTKGILDQDIIRGDNFTLNIDGKDYVAIRVGEWDIAYSEVELPDGTSVPGARASKFQFDIEIMDNHETEINFFEGWTRKCSKDPIPPDSKKDIVITQPRNSGEDGRTRTALSCHIVNKSTSELSIEDGPESYCTTVYTISCDDGEQT